VQQNNLNKWWNFQSWDNRKYRCGIVVSATHKLFVFGVCFVSNMRQWWRSKRGVLDH